MWQFLSKTIKKSSAGDLHSVSNSGDKIGNYFVESVFNAGLETSVSKKNAE
jgi:hypothetical protein